MIIWTIVFNQGFFNCDREKLHANMGGLNKVHFHKLHEKRKFVIRSKVDNGGVTSMKRIMKQIIDHYIYSPSLSIEKSLFTYPKGFCLKCQLLLMVEILFCRTQR